MVKLLRLLCVFLLGRLRWSPVVTVFVFVRFSLGAPVHQLPDHDRDGGPPGTRENLHLHEAHQVPELDRRQNQRYWLPARG